MCREIRALAGTFGSAIRRLILLMMSDGQYTNHQEEDCSLSVSWSHKVKEDAVLAQHDTPHYHHDEALKGGEASDANQEFSSLLSLCRWLAIFFNSYTLHGADTTVSRYAGLCNLGSKFNTRARRWVEPEILRNRQVADVRLPLGSCLRCCHSGHKAKRAG